MKCHRCGGAMIYERCYGGDGRFWGWKCLICGEIVDGLILENRLWGAGEPKHKKSSAKKPATKKRGERDRQADYEWDLL